MKNILTSPMHEATELNISTVVNMLGMFTFEFLRKITQLVFTHNFRFVLSRETLIYGEKPRRKNVMKAPWVTILVTHKQVIAMLKEEKKELKKKRLLFDLI